MSPDKGSPMATSKPQLPSRIGEATATRLERTARMDKQDEARKILRRLQGQPRTQYVSSMSIVGVYCAVGDKDHALQWLEKAVEQHDANADDITSLPFLDPLRGDPRFHNLLQRLGLPSHN